jgi:forespore regulator of the sigma-K checkpoint
MRMGFSLWKELRRRLRRGMRPGGLRLAVVWLAAAACAAVTAVPDAAAAAPQALSDDPADARRYEAVRSAGPVVDVTLRRSYVCGEETQPLGRMTAAQAIELLRRHPDWRAVPAGEGAVILEERINDLSPACKESAVFGIDADGRLSLFDGPPERSKVLRTFWQLDVRHMETSLPKDRYEALVRGIRVSDLEEYNSVLSSFSEYAAPADAGAFDASEAR